MRYHIPLTHEQREFIRSERDKAKRKALRTQIKTENASGPRPATPAQVDKWRAEGLIELDPGKPMSGVRCLECGKETSRWSPRHHYASCKFYVSDKEKKLRRELQQMEEAEEAEAA